MTGGARFAERDTCMIKLVAAAALAAGLSSAVSPSAYAAQGANNGTWSVELVTESGLCSARYTYALAIRESQVQLVSGEAGARARQARRRTGTAATPGVSSLGQVRRIRLGRPRPGVP